VGAFHIASLYLKKLESIQEAVTWKEFGQMCAAL